MFFEQVRVQAFLSSVIKFAVKGVFLSFSCFFFLGADLVSTYYVSMSNKVLQVNRRGFVWLTILCIKTISKSFDASLFSNVSRIMVVLNPRALTSLTICQNWPAGLVRP